MQQFLRIVNEGSADEIRLQKLTVLSFFYSNRVQQTKLRCTLHSQSLTESSRPGIILWEYAVDFPDREM